MWMCVCVCVLVAGGGRKLSEVTVFGVEPAGGGGARENTLPSPPFPPPLSLATPETWRLDGHSSGGERGGGE